MTVFRLSPRGHGFPPPHLAEPDGLLAVGGDLSAERLLAAYAAGIFPWYGPETPILWWSPNPRCVLLPKDLHVPTSLRRVLNAGRFTFTVNNAFGEVIRHCASAPRPGQTGTWIVPDMIDAYTRLHELGCAYSVEAWQDDSLVAGFYGVALGRAFFGESMFTTVPDASKAAFVWFVRHLRSLGFILVDCQQTTAHMLRFGAQEMERKTFLKLLDYALQPTRKDQDQTTIMQQHPQTGRLDTPDDDNAMAPATAAKAAEPHTTPTLATSAAPIAGNGQPPSRPRRKTISRREATRRTLARYAPCGGCCGSADSPNAPECSGCPGADDTGQGRGESTNPFAPPAGCSGCPSQRKP